MKEVTLPSGRTAKISPATFAESKEVYQDILSEANSLDFSGARELDPNFIKNILCTLLTSRKLEASILVCCKRVDYNGQRIADTSLFEDEEGRMDYFDLLREVAMFNISPFTKSLSAEFGNLSEIVEKLDSLK
jgi:hypothetical protein